MQTIAASPLTGAKFILCITGCNLKDVHDLHICNIMYQPSFLMDSCQDLGQLPGYHELFVIEPYLSQNDKFQQFLKLDFQEMEKAGRMIAGLLEEYSSKELGNRQSRLTVTEIAYESGFQSVSYFSRLFRQEYGMSPREYRR